jgi:hypothetical protein
MKSCDVSVFAAWWGLGPVGAVGGGRGVIPGLFVAVECRFAAGFAGRVARGGLVVVWLRGLCQPVGVGSALRRANAVVRSLAQG